MAQNGNGKTRQRAKVKWFDSAKGFGFLAPYGGGKDIFVHFTGIEMDGYKTLEQDQIVDYDTEPSPKGPKAVNVRVVG
jgi:CspA family cold shock protein